jgi:hypothetical protein
MRGIGYNFAAFIALAGAVAYISLAPAHGDGAATPVFDVHQMPAGYRDWRVVSVAHEAGNSMTRAPSWGMTLRSRPILKGSFRLRTAQSLLGSP